MIEETNDNIEKNNRRRKALFWGSCLILVIVLLWLMLVLFEYNRVKHEKKPVFCFNNVQEIENDKEYSKTCYGILYKYREYYFKVDDSLSAREFTLIFKEFKRKPTN